MKRVTLLGLMIGLILTICLLIGCGNSMLITTEKTLPEDFYELADQGVLAHVTSDQESFEAQWAYYGFSGTPEEHDWETKQAIFLGVFESGSCPYAFKGYTMDHDEATINILLDRQSKSKACTDDATPRAFVFMVNKDQFSGITHLKIDGYDGLKPLVKLKFM